MIPERIIFVSRGITVVASCKQEISVHFCLTVNMVLSCIWSSSCGFALQLCIQDLVRVSVYFVKMCGPIGEELSTPVESFSIVQQHSDSLQYFILCGVFSFCCVSSSVFLIFPYVTHQRKIKQ